MDIASLRTELARHRLSDSDSLWRRKQIAEMRVRIVIDAIDAERRDPDAWEAEHLREALGAILMHRYDLAAERVDTAITPHAPAAPDAAGEPTTLRQLRRALETVVTAIAPAD